MTKKLTKKQREAQALAALTKRITDIYSGAAGAAWLEHHEWPTAELLSVIAPAIKSVFECEQVPDFVWALDNLDKFEQPSKIAHQLFAFGVRA